MDIAWTALALSLKVAAWATALNLLLGIGTGYLLARTRFPGRELLDALLTLPMVMPPTVLGYYLLVLLGRRGTSRTIRPADQTLAASSSWSVQPVLPMWGYVRVTSWRA